MQDPELSKLTEAIRDYFTPQLEQSEPLRRLARSLGEWLIAISEETADSDRDTPTPSPADHRGPDEGAPDVAGSPVVVPQVTQQVDVPLKLGDQSVSVTVRSSGTSVDSNGRSESRSRQERGTAESTDNTDRSRPPHDDGVVDLGRIVARCRLKAASCRLFIERRAAEGDPTLELPLVDQVNAMIDEARQMVSCFLWVFWRERSQPADADLRIIADCYDAMAAAVELMQFMDTREARRSEVETAFQLLAATHSALRVALERTWLTSPDSDQMEVHQWMRHETAIRQIYVHRHMKLDDPADPGEAPTFINQIRALHSEIESRLGHSREIDGLLKRIRYHADLLDSADPDELAHHTKKIDASINTLLEAGVPSSDPRFRDVLPPGLLTSLPTELVVTPSAARVMDEVDSWHESQSAAPVLSGAEPVEWSAQVLRVRRLLQGRSIVIIGGEPRPEAERRMKEAFELSQVIWPQLNEHASPEPMRAPITRADTALVVVLIKLTGHQYADEARRVARSADKPCVLLTAGYNPEQIADSVLKQASEQLADFVASDDGR